MRVIIAGSRTITDYAQVLDAIRLAAFPITEVVCGMARGVDMLGHRWAVEHSVPVAPFPANWERYGLRAGRLRNSLMARKADALIAIWDSESTGTAHMIEAALAHSLRIFVHTPRPRSTQAQGSGWCARCGCGNSSAGYAHTPLCPTSSVEPR